METPESLIEHYKAVRHRIETAKFVPRAIPAPKINVCYIRPVPEPKPNEAATPTPRNIVQMEMQRILDKRGCVWADVFGARRFQKHVNCRNEIWFYLQMRGMSLAQIGRICRPLLPYDHTTVLHGIRQHMKTLEKTVA